MCRADGSDPSLSEGAGLCFLTPPWRHPHWVSAPRYPLILSPTPCPVFRLRLPSVEEAEGPESPPPAPGDGSEGVQAVARTRQERRQRRRAVEDAQTPARGQLEAGGGGDSPGPVQVQQQPLVPKREVEAPPRRRLSREQRGPWAREEESVAAREPGGRLKGVSGKPAASEPPVPEKPPAPGKPSAAERRLVSEKASVFEKSLRSETKLVPRKAAPSDDPPAREQPAAGGRPCTSSEQRARDLPEKNPPSSAEPGASDPPTRASHLPPITLQVGGAPAPLNPTRAPPNPTLAPSLCPVLSAPADFVCVFSPYLHLATVRIGVPRQGWAAGS